MRIASDAANSCQDSSGADLRRNCSGGERRHRIRLRRRFRHRLLARADLGNPQNITHALCPGNDLRPAKFMGRQSGNPERDSGRDLADNFDFQSGNVFRLSTGEVAENGACLIVPKPYFDQRRLVPLDRLHARQEEGNACREALRARISKARQRKVSACWPLARLAEREAIFAVVFEHRGSDALAALVLDVDQQLRFMDYRGNATDESSVWRVDDGGQFYPDAFDILFALQGQEGLEIGVEWQGAEGSSLHVLRADGDRLHEVLEGYFYRSP